MPANLKNKRETTEDGGTTRDSDAHLHVSGAGRPLLGPDRRHRGLLASRVCHKQILDFLKGDLTGMQEDTLWRRAKLYNTFAKLQA